MKKTPFCLVAFFALFLAACGDEETKEITQVQSSIVVASLKELPPCDDEYEGTLAWVGDEKSTRMCVDGSWFATSAAALSCTVEDLADKSGIKILCNGDSVGVIHNGVDGAPGENGTSWHSDSNCSVNLTSIDSVSVICGSDTVSIPVPISQETIADVVLDSEKIAVSLDTVSGVTQKGPFLSGSKVVVRELTDGRTLAQTGNAFNGKIMNDKGEFKINARQLMSQYVSLEATGYYRNEVTGDVSKSELTLLAITNILKNDQANINLLTHLEYERVNYLVTKKKYTVVKAKAQAQQEVFNIFGINSTGFSSSEYLNIAGASAEDGALLAFSILLQGNRSEAQLSELLTKIAADMEKDGSWDDSLTLMKLANWADSVDVSGGLKKIRENITKWRLSEIIPSFEPYVRKFWYKMYGLESCGAKNVGKIVKAKAGANKNNNVRYICREGGLWDLASDVEKDTYEWGAGKDGEVKKGALVKNAYYVYDASDSAWRVASDIEKELSLGCTPRIRDTVVAGSDNYYTCVRQGDFWEKCSLYNGCDGWIVSSVTQSLDDKYPGCFDDGHGKIPLSELPDDLRCVVEYVWQKVSNYIAENTNDEVCTEGKDGLMRGGLKDNRSSFVCDHYAWREATTLEEKIHEPCSMSRLDTLAKDTALVCDKNGWRKTNFYDYPKGYFFEPDEAYDSLMTDARDGRKYRVVTIGSQQWMAENLNFNDNSNNLKGKTYCYGFNSVYGASDPHEDNCEKGGRLYSWTAAMNVNSKWFEASAYAAGKIDSLYQGICPSGWRIPTSEEWCELFKCNEFWHVDESSIVELKAKGVPEWGEASNESGFSAYPTGTGIISSGMLSSENEPACWWTTEEEDYESSSEKQAYYAFMRKDAAGIASKEKTYVCGVRCVRRLEVE